MKINKNSLLKSLASSLILLLIIIIYFSLRFEKIEDNVLSIFLFFIIVIGFAGLLFWTYQQIEYYKKKYKDEKKPWYSWLWWPARTIHEACLFRATFFVSILFPFIVFVCLFFLIGYSMFIGLIFAFLLFLIIISSITEFSNWQEKRYQHNNENQFPFRKYKIRVTPILVLILIIMIISLPYLEEPKGNYMDQRFIGTWKNSEITFKIKKDQTCIASYRNSTYNGRWNLISGLGYIEITWYQELKLPHPNDNSYLYTVEQIFLIDKGNKISLYTPFSAPENLTLVKV
jgi:hypothetical protein